MLNRLTECLVAFTGVFAGSLLWDVIFGDGIQSDDYSEAITVGMFAAVIQWIIGSMYRRLQR